MIRHCPRCDRSLPRGQSAQLCTVCRDRSVKNVDVFGVSQTTAITPLAEHPRARRESCEEGLTWLLSGCYVRFPRFVYSYELPTPIYERRARIASKEEEEEIFNRLFSFAEKEQDE